MEGPAEGLEAGPAEVARAFGVYRDRFPEMTDDEYRRDVIEPMVRCLLPLAVRALVDALPCDLADAVREAVASG